MEGLASQATKEVVLLEVEEVGVEGLASQTIKEATKELICVQVQCSREGMERYEVL